MSIGKYNTMQQKAIKHDIETLNRRISYYRRMAEVLQREKRKVVKALGKEGIIYGGGYKNGKGKEKNQLRCNDTQQKAIGVLKKWNWL
jgi:hypothetical protein